MTPLLDWGSIRMPRNDLMIHMNAPYDPAKRHKYYEEHKHLKGRRPGKSVAPTSSRSQGGKVIPLRNRQPTLHSQANQAAVQARVDSIKNKLNQLKAHLHELLAQAHKSSTTKSSTTTKKSTQKKPQTAAQKAAQKKAAKKSAEKRHEKAQANTTPTVTEQIAQVREQIQQVETNLRAAVAEARRLASAHPSQTASSGR